MEEKVGGADHTYADPGPPPDARRKAGNNQFPAFRLFCGRRFGLRPAPRWKKSSPEFSISLSARYHLESCRDIMGLTIS